jgi:diacylglycerol kinase
MVDQKAPERFSASKRAKSFTHAGRGVWIFLRTTHNAWIHITILSIAVAFGLYFQIAYYDWMLLVLAAGMVITAEAFNTAIEIDIDLTSPEYHPYARDTKDVASGAVLIASITAVVIGIGIFGHYFLTFLSDLPYL